jgi:SAM-dependent methyltransferase
MAEADELLRKVERYYTGKFTSHGPVARGVDWNSTESQELRFEQLLHCVDNRVLPYSLLDYGCGYGALAQSLLSQGDPVTYVGVDLSGPMIEHANQRFAGVSNVRFEVLPADLAPVDYVVASGIFNLRFDYTDATWSSYVTSTLDTLSGLARRGFAFNMLTKYSDPERMRPDLYYPDPCLFFDYCKRRFSRNVALLHDYGLYEFTMIVRIA